MKQSCESKKQRLHQIVPYGSLVKSVLSQDILSLEFTFEMEYKSY